MVPSLYLFESQDVKKGGLRMRRNTQASRQEPASNDIKPQLSKIARSVSTHPSILFKSCPSEMMEQDADSTDEPMLWRLGIFDAHCHPTDIMGSIDKVGEMNAKVLTIMASRSQDQDLVAQVASRFPMNSESVPAENHTCRVIPAFGWHPWFSYQIHDDRGLNPEKTLDLKSIDHYRNVLSPEPEDEGFLNSLPAPRSLTDFLKQTEERLLEHPFALVGEVGLDRAFRLPVAAFVSPPPPPANRREGEDLPYTPGSREGRSLSPYRVNIDHQKMVLKAQLQLAGKLNRPVSIHSVQTHGVVFEVLRDLWAGHEKISKRQQKRRKSVTDAHTAVDQQQQEALETQKSLPYPPRICMHSYSGPPDPLRQFLHPSVPADVYFSFSYLINFSDSSSAKTTEVIKVIPASQILIESDFHCAGEQMDHLLESVTRKICHIKDWPLKKGVEQLRTNWERFVFGEP